jgi:dTDP-4-dehydrorhamnose reductase
MVEFIPFGTEIPVVSHLLMGMDNTLILLPQATKMSILRPACYKKFASIISEIYVRFERGTGLPKQQLTQQPELEAFIKQTIVTALGEKSAVGLEKDTDLFAFGVDSLTATRVRNEIVKGLELGDIKLGQNVVYEHPSISHLARYLLEAQAGGMGLWVEADHQLMLDMVDKYASQLNGIETGTQTRGDGAVVILTGATGSLGAHILDQLTRRSEVSKVICLSRASSHTDSLRRIRESLELRQRNLSALSLSKIHSLAADVNLSNLGLSSDELSTLSETTTHIIHNAWPVNFNLSLQSFEPHIQGVIHLLALAMASNAKFYFSSSVGTRQGRADGIVKEDFPDSPVTAGGMGYGRSKWVVEKVMESVKGDVGVLRIGQLVGDTEQSVNYDQIVLSL